MTTPLQRQPLDLNGVAEEALYEALRLVPTDDPDEAVEAVTALVLGSLRPSIEAAVRRAFGGVTA